MVICTTRPTTHQSEGEEAGLIPTFPQVYTPAAGALLSKPPSLTGHQGAAACWAFSMGGLLGLGKQPPSHNLKQTWGGGSNPYRHGTKHANTFQLVVVYRIILFSAAVQTRANARPNQLSGCLLMKVCRLSYCSYTVREYRSCDSLSAWLNLASQLRCLNVRRQACWHAEQ